MKQTFDLRLTRTGMVIETSVIILTLPNEEVVRIKMDSMGDLDINMSNDALTGFIRTTSANSFEICFR